MTDAVPPSGHRTDLTVNAAAWNRIAVDRPPAEPGRVPRTIAWTSWPGHGPGADWLGDLTGLTVAELGCGPGEHTAFAATHGARHAIGIDLAEERITQARASYGHLPAVEFRTGDAAHLLTDLPPLDVCFSIYGALWYAAPTRLLPLIRQQLWPGGLLAVSANAPREGEQAGRRVDNVSTCDGGRLPVIHYSYDAAAWRQMLNGSGFTHIEIRHVPGPPGSSGYRTLVLRARAADD